MTGTAGSEGLARLSNAVSPAPSAFRLGGETPGTPSFFLLYLAVGLLLGEAAIGIVLVTTGASLLKSSGSPSGTAAQMPNGVARTFELTAYMTGFLGVNGSINGVRNPTLAVGWGDTVTIKVTNGEAQVHNLHVDSANVQTRDLAGKGATDALTFRATTEGSFAYYCAIPGHRQAGMAGTYVVGEPTGVSIGPEANRTVDSIAQNPSAIPPPIHRNYSTTIHVYLHAEEVTAEIEPGVSFTYWTYNATVPGPFLRVRLGDTVIVHFYNDPTSMMNHSVDFHAVTGPGGGGAVTQTMPGHYSNFSFLAMVPGLFVYHCASPNIPTHLAEGMYGLILVEPPQGLPTVDHEYYLMQGELYTVWPVHTMGAQQFNGTALLNGDPTYVVFNGAWDALTGAHQLSAKVNETVRLFFGVGGPSFISSFHMIGSMFDEVYAGGDLTDPPLHGLQTVMVAPGSAMMTDFMTLYPAKYPLVDHNLVNAIDKGAWAILNVSGWANSSIFQKLSSGTEPLSVPATAPLWVAAATRSEGPGTSA